MHQRNLDLDGSSVCVEEKAKRRTVAGTRLVEEYCPLIRSRWGKWMFSFGVFLPDAWEVNSLERVSVTTDLVLRRMVNQLRKSTT